MIFAPTFAEAVACASAGDELQPDRDAVAMAPTTINALRNDMNLKSIGGR